MTEKQNGSGRLDSEYDSSRITEILAGYIDRLNSGEMLHREDILREEPELGEEILEELRFYQTVGASAVRDETLGTLGDYTLRRQIGRGGMGVVYEAWQGSLDREVALKILPAGIAADNRAFVRFMREAKTAAQLNHPNVVGVHSVGLEKDTPYYAMELVEGETLAQIIAEVKDGEPETETPFGKKDSVVYFGKLADAFADVADGLQHAHSKGVTHRDIKPSNLILDSEGRLRILDFGLARLEGQESLTLSGDFVGTPLYMSPEQARKRKIKVDHRTDVYSLGATLYEVVCGRPPFRGRDHQDTLSQIIERDPVEPRKVNLQAPRELETIVLKCLRKDPGDRYGTAEALGQDLRRFVRGDRIEARPERPWDRFARFTVRHRKALAVGASLLLLVLVGLAVGVVLVTGAYSAAEQARSEAVRQLYAYDVPRAKQDFDTGNFGRFVRLIERHRPQPGDAPLQGWEYYYLEALRYIPRHILKVDSRGVLSLAWSPGSNLLASGSVDGAIRIWDATTGTLSRSPLPAGASPVRALAWSPDGRRPTAIWEDGMVKAWDLDRNGEILLEPPHSDRSDGRVCRALAWSPDGTLLATAAGDGVVKVWNEAAEEILATLPVRADCVSCLAWRPDGAMLAAALRGRGEVVLWRAADWATEASFRATGGYLWTIAWSPEGSRLASGDDAHTVAIWNTATLEEISRFVAHTGHVFSVDWNPDGERLVSGGQDGVLKIWNLADEDAEPVTLCGHSGEISCVRWNPEGSLVASAGRDGTVKIWDPAITDSGRVLPDTMTAAWSPDGQWLTTISKGNGALRILDATTGKVVGALESADHARQAMFSPDGRLLSTVANGDVLSVWDWQRGAEVGRVEGRHGGRLLCVGWSPKGRLLATGGRDARLRIWEAASLELVRELAGHPTKLKALAWSPDGSMLATTSPDLALKIWDTDSWQILRDLKRGHRTGEDLSWTGPRMLAWRSDSRRLAAVSTRRESALSIWDMPSGSEVFQIPGHASAVLSVAWSPDGRRLATGGFDRKVKIWDAETGDELLTLGVEGTGAVAVKWHPAGQQLIAVSSEVKIWDAGPGFSSVNEE